MTEGKSFDSLPAELPDSAILYLTAPTKEIEQVLRAQLQQAGLAANEPFPNVLAVSTLEQNLKTWGEACSHILAEPDLTTTRCHLASSDDPPTNAELMRSHSLGCVIAWLNGRWLNEVLKAGSLTTYFQPIVRSANPQHVYAYECLLRGREADGQIITPDRLFSAARATGLLDRLDQAARLTAIETASEKQLDTCVFVNLNPRSINDPAKCLASTLRATLTCGVAPEQFVFEVVESDKVADASALNRILDPCRDAGCRVALDDLGSGYSSLNLMAEIKPDFVKLDMQLIRNVHQDRYKAQVAAKLLELARDLEVRTVVEGVETFGEWQWAMEHGADFAQGYLFAQARSHTTQAGVSRCPAGLRSGESNVAAIRSRQARTPTKSTQDWEPSKMSPLVSTTLWVLPSVLLALSIGYYLGRQLGKEERETTLKSLMVMLQTSEQLSNDVDLHNNELDGVRQTVCDMRLEGELEDIQNALLHQIKEVVKSNQKLEDDLVCARYTLELQAQELDRTRLEARVDALSGVANRKAFDETLSYWLSNSKRKQDKFALVITDIDHFKWINDTHGHAAGDRVVNHVGAVLKDCLRGEDYVARYGGDEFVILLRHAVVDSAAKVAERIRTAVETQNFNVGLNGERVAVTFSMGLAVVEEDDVCEAILRRADQALYRAKQLGRNCLQVYTAPVTDQGDASSVAAPRTEVTA